MIAYVKGTLQIVNERYIVIETGGIGYMIIVPSSVFERLPAIGTEVTVYTYMAVREDAVTLYGFLNQDDEQMFEKLITVNGIGPKGAVGILSVLTPDELRFAILSDDVKAISKVPGIGAKTAGRLVLELKDKIDLQDASSQKSNNTTAATATSGFGAEVKNETIAALLVLGYSQSEAVKAVNMVAITEDMTVEQVLKMALRFI